MDLRRLEGLMEEEPAAAEAEIEQLVEQHDVGSLRQIIHEGHTHAVKLRAVQALGEVGDAESVTVLSSLVETLATGVEGGTEQKIERDQLHRAAVHSLAQTRSEGP